MRFKRVTKLLACILSVSMCTVPVFASGSSAWKDVVDDGKDTTIDVGFGVNSAVIKAKVPTSFDLKVNPLYKKGDTSKKVETYTVASKEFVISNNTSANIAGVDQGVALLCTAKGTLTKKDEVMVSYNKFTPQTGDSRKMIHLELTSANAGPTAAVAESQNKYDNTIPRNTVPVTAYGSRLQVAVPAPTLTGGVVTGKYAAFAITGDANTTADWASDDVKVSLSYRLRAVQDTPLNNPAVAVKTATSANNAKDAAGNVIALDSELTKAALGTEAKVVGVMIHSPSNAFEGGNDYPMPASELKIDETATGYKVTIPAENPGIDYLAAPKFNGKTQDLLIGLSDGRVIVSKLTVN